MVVDVVDSFGGDGGNLEQFHRGGGGRGCGYYHKRIGLSLPLSQKVHQGRNFRDRPQITKRKETERRERVERSDRPCRRLRVFG